MAHIRDNLTHATRTFPIKKAQDGRTFSIKNVSIFKTSFGYAFKFDSCIFNAIDSMKHERESLELTQLNTVNKLSRQFYICCVFAIPCFIYGLILPHTSASLELLFNRTAIFGSNYPHLTLNSIILRILSTLVQFYGCTEFCVSAYKAAMKKTININTSILIGSTIAWIYATISLLYAIFCPFDAIFKNGYRDIHYEPSSTIITVILLGLLLQSKVTRKTTEVISNLMKLQPFDAVLVRTNEFGPIEVNATANGSRGIYSSNRSGVVVMMVHVENQGLNVNEREEVISAELIEENDIIKIYAGSRVPLDGIIMYVSTMIDDSIITGESFPKHVKIGDYIMASSLNVGNNVTYIQEMKHKSECRFKVIELMKISQNNK